MNIEKCECDRLGYEYRDLLEQVVSVLHHIPYAKDYISEERIDKLYNLVIKLATGDCEIIEFKRKLCRYDVTEKIDEQDKQIQELTNNWNELEEWLKEEYLIVKANRIEEPNNYEWYIKINERRNILDKMKEIKEGNNE